MTVEFYCDYCGSFIEGGIAEIRSDGTRSADGRWHIERETYYYCADDSDEAPSCYRVALDVLDSMRTWARGEDDATGLTWQLVAQGETAVRSDQGHMDKARRRNAAGAPLYKTALQERVCGALNGAGIYTLEEVAARTRAEVFAIDGVGPKTMQKLDAAMADRGLSWTEAG